MGNLSPPAVTTTVNGKVRAKACRMGRLTRRRVFYLSFQDAEEGGLLRPLVLGQMRGREYLCVGDVVVSEMFDVGDAGGRRLLCAQVSRRCGTREF